MQIADLSHMLLASSYVPAASTILLTALSPTAAVSSATVLTDTVIPGGQGGGRGGKCGEGGKEGGGGEGREGGGGGGREGGEGGEGGQGGGRGGVGARGMCHE